MAKEIHPTAIISPNAELEEDTYIGPFCIIHDDFISKGDTSYLKCNNRGSYPDRGELHDIPVHQHRATATGFKICREKTAVAIGNNNTIREYVTIHRASVVATELL